MTFIIERELVSEQIYQVETVFANQGAVMLLAGGLGGPPRFVKKKVQIVYLYVRDT